MDRASGSNGGVPKAWNVDVYRELLPESRAPYAKASSRSRLDYMVYQPP